MTTRNGWRITFLAILQARIISNAGKTREPPRAARRQARAAGGLAGAPETIPICPRRCPPRRPAVRAALAADEEAVVDRLEAEPGVIVHRLRRRQQQQRDFPADRLAYPLDQRAADAAVLVGTVHRQVGQVAAVAEVGQRPADADQPLAVPGREHQIGIGEHPLDPRQIVAGTADAGGVEHPGHFGGGEGGIAAIVDHAGVPRAGGRLASVSHAPLRAFRSVVAFTGPARRRSAPRSAAGPPGSGLGTPGCPSPRPGRRG